MIWVYSPRAAFYTLVCFTDACIVLVSALRTPLDSVSALQPTELLTAVVAERKWSGTEAEKERGGDLKVTD